MFNLPDKVYLNLKMNPDDIRPLIHGEVNANQKSSARTNTKKTTIWSIGWIGVDRFEGVWHPNFINPLEYEKSFHNQLSLPQAQLFVPLPPVSTGYAQTNRPGQIGLNQYYDYCRCHHQHSFQRNGWTLKILLLCLITTPLPPLPRLWKSSMYGDYPPPSPTKDWIL